jgi:lysophospholipase L1-like esterase
MQLMIVGDSFTQGIEVSDDKMYYRHLEELLGCQAYAYGMASYSTLQQYLIIDQYIETIKPDMVLLQFCTNDFIENNFDLISQSRAPRGGMRPFLRQNGKIGYHYPESKWKLLIDQTYVLKDLLRRMGFDLNQVPEEQASSQWKIAHETERYRPYHTALSTTEQILKMIQDRVGEETPFLIFCADNYEPQQSDLLKICKKLEIPMLSFPTAKMIPNYSKLETYSKDTWHWNEIGHRIMGEELAQSIQHIISN